MPKTFERSIQAMKSGAKKGGSGRPPTREERRHALLAPTVLNSFEVLDVAITLWEPGRWRELHERPDPHDLLAFEMLHGVEAERVAYNNRCLGEARRLKRPVLASHSGFEDLFVPVVANGRVQGVLVTGPFARSRPTSAELLEGWRSLTGRQGDPADPEFSHYLESALSTLVLEGSDFEAFQALVQCLARLMALEGSAERLLSEIEALQKKLYEARLVERMWRVAHSLVDERTSRAWASPNRRARLWQLGIKRYPEQVIVGLFVNRAADMDPVDELLRRDAFQRACVRLARKSGNAASGRIGGYGITFLSSGRGSVERTRRHLRDLAEQAARLARQSFGLELHVGVGARPGSLAEQYQAALSAAEVALSSGERVRELAGDLTSRGPIGPLRRELAELVEEKPSALPAHFDRYVESVAARSGHRLDLVRAHVEAGFERIVEGVQQSGVLDAKSLSGVLDRVGRAALEAGTVSELSAAYRRAVSEVVEALLEPRSAARDRSLRRADEYIRQHYTEPLTLGR
ncbi:MAG TPA: hypothetical protein VGP93_09435, partial [Polyangiaceae bacterium]|nr:hypothetical protein [Polyangiaceae bacterium]